MDVVNNLNCIIIVHFSELEEIDFFEFKSQANFNIYDFFNKK